MKGIIAGAVMLPLALGFGVPADAQPAETPLAREISNVISTLDKATFLPVRKDWVSDNGFGEGSGLLNTYEYLRSLRSFEELQSKLPMDIFLSGPHTRTALNLQDKYTFGHYNPEFVKYFHRAIGTLLEDKSFVSLSRNGMMQYGLLEKLEQLREIYTYIDKHPQEFDGFRNRYKRMLDERTWPDQAYDGYRKFLPDALDSSQYWNWAETDYYFWIRRDIDGTKPLWIGVIDDVLKAYDAEPDSEGTRQEQNREQGGDDF